jgi:hypothetical protein
MAKMSIRISELGWRIKNPAHRAMSFGASVRETAWLSVLSRW